jgi:hypothetical protein
VKIPARSKPAESLADALRRALARTTDERMRRWILCLLADEDAEK